MNASAARPKRTQIYKADELAGIRKAAGSAATILKKLLDSLRPGLSTWELNELAFELIKETGGTSAFHGYRGFPGQICISVNDEVVHGIGRKDKIIELNDLVSLDVGVKLNGFNGDNASTKCIGGDSDSKDAALLKAGRECLEVGIAAARAGNRVTDIGREIENHARQAGFPVVRDFVGHGCGRELHEPPEVPNFACKRPGIKLLPGMVLAIEPMLNQGSAEIKVDNDGWTVRTKDRLKSVHFEHMITITNGKAEILTWPMTL